MLLLPHHRGLDGHDHVEGARSGIHHGFTAVSFAGSGARRSVALIAKPIPGKERPGERLGAVELAHE
jgi:hypothetical protein